MSSFDLTKSHRLPHLFIYQLPLLDEKKAFLEPFYLSPNSFSIFFIVSGCLHLLQRTHYFLNKFSLYYSTKNFHKYKFLLLFQTNKWTYRSYSSTSILFPPNLTWLEPSITSISTNLQNTKFFLK